MTTRIRIPAMTATSTPTPTPSPTTDSPTRRLTIGRHTYDHRRDGRWTDSEAVPDLRLSGQWLARAGFAIGRHVRIEVGEHGITLIPERDPPALRRKPTHMRGAKRREQ